MACSRRPNSRRHRRPRWNSIPSERPNLSRTPPRMPCSPQTPCWTWPWTRPSSPRRPRKMPWHSPCHLRSARSRHRSSRMCPSRCRRGRRRRRSGTSGLRCRYGWESTHIAPSLGGTPPRRLRSTRSRSSMPKCRRSRDSSSTRTIQSRRSCRWKWKGPAKNNRRALSQGQWRCPVPRLPWSERGLAESSSRTRRLISQTQVYHLSGGRCRRSSEEVLGRIHPTRTSGGQRFAVYLRSRGFPSGSRIEQVVRASSVGLRRNSGDERHTAGRNPRRPPGRHLALER